MSHVFGCELREWGTDPVSPLYGGHGVYGKNVLGIVANLLIAGVKVVLGVYVVDRDHEESNVVRTTELSTSAR